MTNLNTPQQLSEVKVRDWKLITLAEKSDINFMAAMKAAYENNVDNYQSKQDYVKIADQLTKLEKAQKVQAEKALKEEEKRLEKLAKEQEAELKRLQAEEEKAQAIAKAAAVRQLKREEFAASFDKSNLYYVGESGKYLYYDTEKNIWTTLSQEATYKLFRAFTPEEKQLLETTLHDIGHMRIRAVNTFKPHAANELNLMDRSKWLKPIPLKDGETVDEWLDLLVTSVACDNPEIKDHLEQAIAWKYHKPDDYKIPAQCPYGKGGAGKNKFIEMVLATIFGRNQIAVIGSDEAFGNFNGQMIGKTVVFIDEAISDKSNSEALKRKVMNETININVKHGVQGTFDSTAMFFIAGNSINGPIKLEGTTTDRRFSLYKNTKSLFEIISEKMKVYWNADDKNDPENAKMFDLYDENEWRFADPTIVGKWLYYILEKWIAKTDEDKEKGKLTHAPTAYHCEAYKELVDVNKAPWVTLCEKIFLNSPDEMKDINHITGADLHKLYKTTTAYALSDKRFSNEVKHWLQAHAPEWEYTKATIWKGVGPAASRTTTTAFIRGGSKTIKCNSDRFFVLNDETKRLEPVWWITA